MQKAVFAHVGNWLLVSDEKDFLHEDMVILQSFIYEGTRVTVLRKRSESGKFIVSSVHVDVEGSMRLVVMLISLW